MKKWSSSFSFYSFNLIALSYCAFSFGAVCLASDINSPFVNGAGLGNAYAGWAADAEDASTEFTNPAGLVRIPHQQIVAAGLLPHSKSVFDGTTTPPFPPLPPQQGRAISHSTVLIPNFYYAARMTDRVVFGFGATSPVGLSTHYANNSILRYGATSSQIVAVNIGPGIGVQLTDKLSVGFGADAQRLSLDFNRMVAPPPFLPIPDFESLNHTAAWAYGMHAGALYQFNPATRVGVAYHSQTVSHTAGHSKIFGAVLPYGQLESLFDQNIDFTLPATAQVSFYRDLNKKWTVMGSIFYIDWSALKEVTLQNIIIPTGQLVSGTTPLNYHDTFDYALGLNYKMNDKWMFRTGVQYLDTPTNLRDRIVANPVSTGTVVGLGVHYQHDTNLGYDLGYTHVFFNNTEYNHNTPTSTEFGHIRTRSDVLGGQVTWSFG